MRVVIIFLALFLSGCVSATYRNGDKSVTYNDLFKSASDVVVTWGEVSIAIGDISSEITAEEIAAYLKVRGALAAPGSVE